MQPPTSPLDSSLDYSGVVVVIPALNEEESLPLTLGELPPVGHVLVVDNGSTDRTAEVARECGAEVVSQPNRGYGNACQAGIARARELGCTVLVIMDADHSDHPEELPLLVDPVLKDPLVIRFLIVIFWSPLLPAQIPGIRCAMMMRPR